MIKDKNESFFGHQREKLMVTVSLNSTSVSHGVFDRTTTKNQQKIKKKKFKEATKQQ